MESIGWVVAALFAVGGAVLLASRVGGSRGSRAGSARGGDAPVVYLGAGAGPEACDGADGGSCGDGGGGGGGGGGGD